MQKGNGCAPPFGRAHLLPFYALVQRHLLKSDLHGLYTIGGLNLHYVYAL